MKNKLITLSFLIIILISLTGCGNSTKTLTCLSTSSEGSETREAELKIKIKDNEVKDMTLTLNMIFPIEQQEYKQMLIYQFSQKTDKVYSTSDGVKAIFGMNSSYFNTLGVSQDASYGEIKQVLELQGYICKE